jgi:hypothetical protein
MGNDWPTAKIATNEKPDSKFSILLAVAKRGASRQKMPVVAVKKISKGKLAGRKFIESQR